MNFSNCYSDAHGMKIYTEQSSCNSSPFKKKQIQALNHTKITNVSTSLYFSAVRADSAICHLKNDIFITRLGTHIGLWGFSQPEKIKTDDDWPVEEVPIEQYHVGWVWAINKHPVQVLLLLNHVDYPRISTDGGCRKRVCPYCFTVIYFVHLPKPSWNSRAVCY